MAKKNKEEQENPEMIDESSLSLDNSESGLSPDRIDSEADAALSYNSYLDPNQTASAIGAAYYDPDDAITRTNDAAATDDVTASMDSYMGTTANPALMDTLENYAGGNLPPIDYTNPTISYQPSNGNYGQGQDSAQMWQEQFSHLRQQLANGLQKLSSATQSTSGKVDSGGEIQLGDFKRLASLIGGGFLAIYGLGRSLGNLTLIGAGAGLVYYALTGQWPLSGKPLAGRSGFSGQGVSGATSTVSSTVTNAMNQMGRASNDTTTTNIIVKAPVSEVYAAWANFENFPNFMKNIKSVKKTGERTSHWVMTGPLGAKIEWDAETTRLEENKRIAWSSTQGDIKTSGQVTFNALPNNDVEITVMLKYVPPAGLAGEIVAELFSDPESKLTEDLRNFKRYIERQKQRA